MRVRLTRVGGRKNPIWRVVVADQRSPRDGRVIETVGRYDPQRQPSEIALDRERIEHWVARGAQPTATVKKLLLAQEREDLPAAARPAQPGKRKRRDPEAVVAADGAEAQPTPEAATDAVSEPEPAAEAAPEPEPAAEAETAREAEAAPQEEDARAAEAEADSPEPDGDAEAADSADSK